MNKTRMIFYKYISCFLCLYFMITLLPVSVSAKQTKSKTIKVGWYEDSYNITGKNGERSGYGYEYQQSVAAYTGWKYQYVEAGWSDLLTMVEEGKIDIMSGVSYTKERAKTMLFSELPMGKEKYYLYADLKHTNISASDLKTLNGKRVGLLKGSIQANQFYKWEKKHHLKLKYIYLTSFEDAKKKAADRKLDCIISTETPQWIENGMSAIVTTGGSNIYFAINKKRPDIKEELDNAMQKMEYDKPFYADELYQKYLSSVSSPILSNEEKEWTKKHGQIRIGFLNDDAGFSTYDQTSGKMSGVINDYIVLSSKCLENQQLKYKIVGFNSVKEQIKALKEHKIDVIFHMSQNPSVAEKEGFALTNTVLSVNMAAVTSKNYFDEDAKNTVAIEKDDILLKWYLSYNYPKWKIVEKDSFTQVKKAVQSGKVDCFVADSGQLTEYVNNNNLHSVNLMKEANTSFAVRCGDNILLSILNKTLKTMSSSMLAGTMAMYENSLKKVTIEDFVKDNLLFVMSAFILIFVLILLLVLSVLRKSRIAEVKAKQADAAKTTFLNNMSHDIRTPMNAIVGITNLMEHEDDISEKMQSYVQKVQVSSQHLLGLLNDILDMSRIESNEVTLNKEEVNLAEQIRQIDSIVRAQTNEHHQKFQIYANEIVHEDLICDGVRLRQILLNLLSNAVKYTQNGGKIIFDLTEVPCEKKNYAKFVYTVIDNGYGMTEEFMEHIFEPFTRAENSMTNKVQGTGLGMTITKNIVDLMGGEIRVESEIGKGSRFEVVVTLEINKEAKREIGIQTVLMITEEERLIRNVKVALNNDPIHLFIASDVEEARKWLKNYHTEVILMDGRNGNVKLGENVSVLRKIVGEETLIFGIDFVSEEDVKHQVMGYNLDGMIQRPFFTSSLALAIEATKSSIASETQDDTFLNGKRFLCAEDNALNAEILKEILSMYGASCTVYADGNEIVEAFKNVAPGEYDAILMDVQMPNMNGLEATRAIRDGENPLGKYIPIIAMTANAFSEDVQQCIGSGMDAHIAKPIDIEILKKTLRELFSLT